MGNKVQLITYVDRLTGSDLRWLQALLENELKEVFGALHLLSFYCPINGADAGFDPIDQRRVNRAARKSG